MIIEKSPKSRYILADYNKLCEGNAVNDLEKCRDAVSEIKNIVPNAFFKNTEVEHKYPKGCSWLERTNQGQKLASADRSSDRSAENISWVFYAQINSAYIAHPQTETVRCESNCAHQSPLARVPGKKRASKNAMEVVLGTTNRCPVAGNA